MSHLVHFACVGVRGKHMGYLMVRGGTKNEIASPHDRLRYLLEAGQHDPGLQEAHPKTCNHSVDRAPQAIDDEKC